MRNFVFSTGQLIQNNYKKTIYATLFCTIIIAIFFLPFLPFNVPMQWSNDGTIIYYLPKYAAVLIFPALFAFLNIVGRYKQKELIYFLLAVLFTIFLVAIFLFIVLHY